MEFPHLESARRRLVPLVAALLAVGFISLSVGMAISESDEARDDQRSSLLTDASEEKQVLEQYFARAESLTQVLSQNPAFEQFYELPGNRVEKVRDNPRAVREANEALAYIESLFPGSVGEACFIDDGGAENARAVHGEIAPIEDLSTDEASTSFFAPTFARRPGQVYQTRPYVSPDTNEWVIANATRVELPRRAGRAIVHFEVTLASFRREAALGSGDADIAVVDARSGETVFDTADDSSLKAPAGAAEPELPPTPGGADFSELTEVEAQDGNIQVEDGRLAAFARLDQTSHNASRWIVVAQSRTPGSSWLDHLGPAHLGSILLAVLLLGLAVVSFRSSQRALEGAALTDPLTGLGNRRKLLADLDRRLDRDDGGFRLAIYDLDGFKAYNDAFGHPAGDALLVRLAESLRGGLDGVAGVYRVGGDEFCVITSGLGEEGLDHASAALHEEGEGFTISSSRGSVSIPGEVDQADEALRVADQRMYANKDSSRASAGSQSTEVLVRVLAERYPDLGQHLGEVADLCLETAERLDLPIDRRTLRQAASLHDVGKIAIPDSILAKPGPLDEGEWRFMRQHTLIGERILASAPALVEASRLVRWSHEQFDGSGYPDGLSGDEIPLGSRIIAVCDAFDAMVSERPYADPKPVEAALSELRRCAGGQFDPTIVAAFTAVVERRASPVGS